MIDNAEKQIMIIQNLYKHKQEVKILSDEQNKEIPTAIIVGNCIATLQESGDDMEAKKAALDEQNCVMCKEGRMSGKGCPFHTLHRNARFFKNHEIAFKEGRWLYLKFLERSDKQSFQEIIDFLLKLGEAESSCIKKDLLHEYTELTSELERQEKGHETLRKKGREKGFTVMFEFFRENFYVFLILKQKPQEILSLFGDFIARRMVPADSMEKTVNPLEYNEGLNDTLSIGMEIFENFVRQNIIELEKK